ncbi:MAG: methyl-accepting chemotaxis protein [Deltaproteobacteria bacterium]|nr:methyl-accepting chemotaxis protein [Deltaproteobacteria bacterium]
MAGHSESPRAGGIASSITTKLILAMILVALIPLAVAGIVIARNTAQNLRTQTEASIQSIANSSASSVAQVVAEQVRLVQTLATMPEIRRHVEQANLGYVGTEEEAINQVVALDDQWRDAPDDTLPLIRTALNADPQLNPSSFLARQFQEQFPNHVEVFTTDKYGALLGSTNKTSDYYQADEGWWQDAWANGSGGIHIGQPELDASTGVFAVNVAVPIRDDARQLLGVLRSTVDIRTVLDILAGASFGGTGTVAIVDTSGNFLFNPQAPDSIGSSALGGDTKPPASGTLETADEVIGFASSAMAGNLQGSTDLGWISIARVKTSEAFAAVANANRVALIAGALALLGAIMAAFLFSRALTRQVRNIQEVFSRIGIGDFQARVDVVSQDEVGQVAENLNAMLDNTMVLIQSQEDRDKMQGSVMKLLDEVSGVAEGDLTREAEVTPEITGAIADSFNFMISELRDLIGEVQETTDGVTGLAIDVRSDMETLSSDSVRQAQDILGASEAIGTLAGSAKQVSENAAGSARVAERSVENARQGAAAVQGTIAGMNAIRGQVQETSKRIKRLGESSQEIGEIVQLIGDIAERTSILALNASIQAAMAGPAGRGFGVVAEEVERLSERAAESTKRISTLVKTIQAETNETVTAMESTTRQVVEGSERANEAGTALQEMSDVVNQLAESIITISRETQSQAESSQSLSATIGQVSETTRKTAQETERAAGALSQLTGLTARLRKSLERFRLPTEANRNVA